MDFWDAVYKHFGCHPIEMIILDSLDETVSVVSNGSKMQLHESINSFRFTSKARKARSFTAWMDSADG